MFVINSILYKDIDENGGHFYCADSEFNNVVVSDTKEGVIDNMKNSIKVLVNHARENPNTSLHGSFENRLFETGLDKIITDSDKYSPIVRDIKGFGIRLHFYDLTADDFYPPKTFPRKKLSPILSVDYK